MKIINVSARKILASSGNETVEAVVVLENGQAVRASVPAGISAGKYEIQKASPPEAVSQIGQISQIVSRKDWTQESLDAEIAAHGYGGNATLAVSAAFYKATMTGLHPGRFPKLFLLLFEGGGHGNPNIATQEFCLVEETITQAEADFATLKTYLSDNSIETLVGAEGAFSPQSFDDSKAITTIKQLFPNQPIALDVAGSFNFNNPDLDGIFSVEDPYDDESWNKFSILTAENKLLVIGDDLTVTNPERIKKAIELKAINGVVIKPDQIGTISAAFDAVKVARAGGLKIVVSHRGEETDDDWIVDFALTVQADYVKFGGLDRGERVAKYNRLRELGMK